MTHTSPMPPLCPSCGLPTVAVERPRTVRRDGRQVTYDALYWRCDAEPAEDGDGPFQFEDASAAAENRRRADAAWQARFGESVPAPRRPGPSPHRTERVHASFDAKALDALDALVVSSDSTRSEALRKLVLEAHEALTRQVAPRPAGARR